MFSLKQVAEILGVHRNTIYNMVVRGEIKAVKVGRDFRITEEEVKRLKEGK